MTDQPFTPEEEAEFYESLGLPATTAPSVTNAVVVQVPDINDITFDDSLIEHLDLSDGQQRAEASRILFARYNASAQGIPKSTHSTNWNSLVHTRISMHLGRRVASKRQEGQDSLRHKVQEASAEKVADTAALSTQAALKVLKDQILAEDGTIDLARFAELLQEA